MLRWQADEELCALLRRYYAGEGDLWGAIRQRVDDELRARRIDQGHYHVRFRRRGDAGYDVLIDDAAAFVADA